MLGKKSPAAETQYRWPLSTIGSDARAKKIGGMGHEPIAHTKSQENFDFAHSDPADGEESLAESGEDWTTEDKPIPSCPEAIISGSPEAVVPVVLEAINPDTSEAVNSGYPEVILLDHPDARKDDDYSRKSKHHSDPTLRPPPPIHTSKRTHDDISVLKRRQSWQVHYIVPPEHTVY
jgi:hypothetical protein